MDLGEESHSPISHSPEEKSIKNAFYQTCSNLQHMLATLSRLNLFNSLEFSTFSSLGYEIS